MGIQQPPTKTRESVNLNPNNRKSGECQSWRWRTHGHGKRWRTGDQQQCMAAAASTFGASSCGSRAANSTVWPEGKTRRRQIQSANGERRTKFGRGCWRYTNGDEREKERETRLGDEEEKKIFSFFNLPPLYIYIYILISYSQRKKKKKTNLIPYFIYIYIITFPFSPLNSLK